MIRRFTGWHMAAILVAFFGVVIAVNVTMATFAATTFGGVVVENSYVASQHYDRWLAEARAQDKAGWRAVPAAAAGRLAIALTRRGDAVADAALTATARHPLGRAPDQKLTLRWDAAAARYLADQPLPPGRWLIEIIGARGAERLRFEDEVRM
ncbi:FixH family protein [uncultured Sphingomonas sp.]|uniref:FixH family protein n=1 Tax=uncultured Sphingomonas sp. TaxID=158754 RepID=UPI00260C8E80|nr:FixH family protein [uncultured Sphingomonas sp.]